MDAAPKPIESYEQLLQLLRDRMVALDTSFEAVESTAGLTERYLAKILGPHPIKRLGPVSWSIFAALGLRLVVLEDTEQLARVRDRLRRPFHVRRSGPHDAWVARQLAANGECGAGK
jgi:hypothetical protein